LSSPRRNRFVGGRPVSPSGRPLLGAHTSHAPSAGGAVRQLAENPVADGKE
jgi:hypothetical protein